ncbi:MAG TPA: alpha/beta hydrolase family protein, partial [Planctomycetota bacterium]|nr:alpha/beta hydrolase family protein [Planctomycetota bacterium]
CDELKISREPLNLYGSLEGVIRGIRDRRPLDLNAETWRKAHPDGTFEAWKRLARACVLGGLHYDPGPVDLRAETLAREERDGFVLERVAFNTTPWFRLNGFFLLPTGVRYPVPGLVVFHAWGGPMLFGRHRIVSTERDHPMLVAHRDKVYSGRFLAEEFARRGYAVIVIDAYHFGERAPRGVGDVPESYDPFDTTTGEYEALDAKVRAQLYLGVRQLMWAGTTWMGVFFYDDSRCVDYLVSRPEVDAQRIGCTGLSVGGWRTDMLAALDERIRASVSVGWMTTCDYQQIYNVAGAVGTFCLLPGVWDRLDVPDLTVMSAPGASMVVSGRQDTLFPVEGQAEAARQIALGYAWAGCPEKFGDHRPDKPHCYDADVQTDAFAWFDRFL